MTATWAGDGTGSSVGRGTQPELMLATTRPKATMFSLLRRNDIIPNLNQEALYHRIALERGHSLSVQAFLAAIVRSSWLQAGDLGDVIEVSIVAVHFGDPLTLHLSRDQGILDIYGVGGVEVEGPKVHLAVCQLEPWE